MNNPYDSTPQGGQFNQDPQYANYGGKPESNPLGLIGFILSLTCLLSPIGLLLSLFALFKRPRGFAIAGTIVGLLLSVVVVGGAYGFYWFANAGRGAMAIGYIAVQSEVLDEQIRAYTREAGSPPTSLDQVALPAGAKIDPWGVEYRLVPASSPNGLLKISSAGPDGQFGTADDIDDIIGLEDNLDEATVESWMENAVQNKDNWPGFMDVANVAREIEEWRSSRAGNSAIAGSGGAPAIDGDGDGDDEGGDGGGN